MGNEMRTQEINAIKKMSNEAKANSISIKCQFDDAKKVYEAEKNKLKADLEIAAKVKLEVIKHAEAETASLKSKLDESQKLNAMKTQKLTKMKEATNDVKANATSLKLQFSETKTKHKVEMQDLQKKLEIETSLKFQSDD